MVDSSGQADSAIADSSSVACRANWLQKQIFMKMSAIDPPRAATSMKAWMKFLHLASRCRATPGSNMKEYLPLRIIDAGELYVFDER